MEKETVEDWLMNFRSDGIGAGEFADEFARRLNAAGVPIDRMVIFITAPHPTVFGQRVIWDKKTGVEILTAPTEMRNNDMYLLSPIYKVRSTALDIHQNLTLSPVEGEYGVYEDLRADGMTDYLMLALPFMEGQTEAISFATADPGGFTDAHTESLSKIRMPFTRVAEIQALKRTAGNLLDAYVGPGIGERIWNGKIHLGDSDKINAVILFCDLRRSSALAENYGSEKFLSVLNSFFSCTAGAILENQGEVLRFIGDAFLAIFPIDDCDNCAEVAAGKALKSAIEAVAALDALNHERMADDQEPMTAGFGLHVGEVLYGNIGTAERLEFTVIGAAANEAARIEGKCAELGQTILVSQEFADALPRQWKAMGTHNFKNVSRSMELFSVA